MGPGALSPTNCCTLRWSSHRRSRARQLPRLPGRSSQPRPCRRTPRPRCTHRRKYRRCTPRPRRTHRRKCCRRCTPRPRCTHRRKCRRCTPRPRRTHNRMKRRIYAPSSARDDSRRPRTPGRPPPEPLRPVSSQELLIHGFEFENEPILHRQRFCSKRGAGGAPHHAKTPERKPGAGDHRPLRSTNRPCST